MDVFKSVYNECFPVIKVKKKYRNRLPWLTDGLKTSIKHKNKLYRISIKHPTAYNITLYKVYRNRLQILLKAEEKQHYSALPNKHTIMLIIFCKIGNAVLLLLGAVW